MERLVRYLPTIRDLNICLLRRSKLKAKEVDGIT